MECGCALREVATSDLVLVVVASRYEYITVHHNCELKLPSWRRDTTTTTGAVTLPHCLAGAVYVLVLACLPNRGCTVLTYTYRVCQHVFRTRINQRLRAHGSLLLQAPVESLRVRLPSNS
eukprot:scaffold386959_cov40-Prasinocladus_malaysianus.AAC.1